MYNLRTGVLYSVLYGSLRTLYFVVVYNAIEGLHLIITPCSVLRSAGFWLDDNTTLDQMLGRQER